MPQKFITLGKLNGFNTFVRQSEPEDFAGRARLGNFGLQRASEIYWNLRGVNLSLSLSARLAQRNNPYDTSPAGVSGYRTYSISASNSAQYFLSDIADGAGNSAVNAAFPLFANPPHSGGDPRVMENIEFSADLLEHENASASLGGINLYGPFIDPNFAAALNANPFTVNGYCFALEFQLPAAFSDIVAGTSADAIHAQSSFAHTTQFLGCAVPYYVAFAVPAQDVQYSISLALDADLYSQADYF